MSKILGARVELLRAFDAVPPEMSDPIHGVYPHLVAESIKSHVQDYLDGVAAPLRTGGLDVSTTVVEGEASRNIVMEAERKPDPLIGMSTHGRSGISRWFMGSITDKVLHTTKNPLLLVSPPEDGDAPSEAKSETVIVPLDQSEIAEEVLPQVAAMSRDAGLNVLLVSATPSEGGYHRYMYSRPLDAVATMYMDPYEEFSKAADAAAMEHLHRAKERIKSMGAIHTWKRG